MAKLYSCLQIYSAVYVVSNLLTYMYIAVEKYNGNDIKQMDALFAYVIIQSVLFIIQSIRINLAFKQVIMDANSSNDHESYFGVMPAGVFALVISIVKFVVALSLAILVILFLTKVNGTPVNVFP